MRFKDTNIKNLVMVSLAGLAVSAVAARADFNPPGGIPPAGNVDAPVYSVGASQAITGSLAVTASSGAALSGSSVGYGLQGTVTTDASGGDAALYATAFGSDATDYAAVFYGGLGVQLASGDLYFLSRNTGASWPRVLDEAALYGVSVTTAGELRLHGHGGGITLRDQNTNTRLTVSEAGVVNVAAGGFLQVNGVNVCLSNGTNCPSATTPNLQTVTNAGNTTTQPITVATLNTGPGAYELYAMNQNVQTTDAPTFATINTGLGAYELYAMNQNVRTTDTPTFTGLSANSSRITSVATPTAGTDAASKDYVDTAVAGAAGGSDIVNNNCSNDYGDSTTQTCTAECPVGYEVVHSAITCTLGGIYVGEGGNPGSWGCAKIVGTLDGGVAHMTFRAKYTSGGSIQVNGTVWCIKN
ncbi:MAG: hypothetical protein HYS45_00010 [Parcubacteria group bacterium]|nr:hypothetical protein [Parcubacteria group bacterium]